MAFRDVLQVLFERAKEKKEVQNQDEFAKRHGMDRAHMNQFLTGNKPVPPKTMWGIIEREGYNFGDCIYLPDVDESLSRKYVKTTKQLHDLLERGGPTRAIVMAAIEAWARVSGEPTEKSDEKSHP